MSRRPPPVTRGVMAALVLAAGAIAPAAGPAATPACAAGSGSVAVVVDFSGIATTTSTCVATSTRDTGATVLAARARALGRPAPRYSASGLLCAIDGFPADGCGVRDDGSYAYWAYYLGRDGTWEYANGGPAGRRVSATTAEGWRWHPAGRGTATDPAPRAAADPDFICRPTPTTVPAATAATAATAAPGVPPPPPPSGPPAVATTGTPPGSATTTVGPGPTPTTPSTAAPPEVSTSRPPPAPPVPAGTSDGESGIPRGVVGGALVVTLGAVGFAVSRRRRRS